MILRFHPLCCSLSLGSPALSHSLSVCTLGLSPSHRIGSLSILSVSLSLSLFIHCILITLCSLSLWFFSLFKSPALFRKRNFITVLGTKNAGKNEISEYLFFHSYPYNLLIIHHLHLCFCIKDSKRKRESRSDCEKEERSDDGNGLCQ